MTVRSPDRGFMAESSKTTKNIYTIKIKGYLDDRWKDWFEGLTFEHENDGTTSLNGPLPDQAALHGVLLRIRDLNLTLISVAYEEQIQQDFPISDQDTEAGAMTIE